MVKPILKFLGVLLLLVGLFGFAAPAAFGAHLSPVHNLVHLVTGALSLWFGTRGSLPAAKAFAIVFGAVYGLLGVLGIVAGAPGAGHDARLLVVVPGVLELGVIDHVIHVVLGLVYLVAGIATHTVPRHGHVPPATPAHP